MIENKNAKKIRRFRRYLRRTYKNKLCAIILFGIGIASTFIDGNITFLVFASLLALALFFAKEDWIY